MGWFSRLFPPQHERLFAAITEARLDRVKGLAGSRSAISWTNDMGQTALHWAIRNCKPGTQQMTRRLVIVKVLVDAGSDLEARTGRGRTPDELAVHEGNLPLAAYLAAVREARSSGLPPPPIEALLGTDPRAKLNALEQIWREVEKFEKGELFGDSFYMDSFGQVHYLNENAKQQFSEGTTVASELTRRAWAKAIYEDGQVSHERPQPLADRKQYRGAVCRRIREVLGSMRGEYQSEAQELS